MLRYHRTEWGVCQIDAIVSLPCTSASKEAQALRHSVRPHTATTPLCVATEQLPTVPKPVGQHVNPFFTSSCSAFERLAARLLGSLPIMPGRFLSTMRNRPAVVLAAALALAFCGGSTAFAAGA